MVTRRMIRFFAIALVGFACVLAREARADGPIPVTLPAPALTAPLQCQASLGEGNLIVTAGFDGLAVPHDVTSLTNPLCPTGTTCSEYVYRFAHSESNLSKAWLSISSDIAIYQAAITSPTQSSGSVFIGECLADKTPTNGLTACAQREVRFSPGEGGTPQMDVKVVVTRSAPRVATIGAFAGIYNSGFCLIQGPGAPGNTVTASTIKATKLLVHGQCSVDVTTGPDGSFTSAVNSAGSTCVETFPTSLAVDGIEIQFEPGRFILIGPTSKQCGLIGGVRKCWCLNAAC